MPVPRARCWAARPAYTPLLDNPLTGGVYLRSSSNKLPDLVVDLEGQLDVELSARIDSVKGGGLRSTFSGVPDAPVSKFVLELQGAKKGLLVNSANLCKGTQRAAVTLVGQNGLEESRKTKIQSSCAKAEKRAKKRRAGSNGRAGK